MAKAISVLRGTANQIQGATREGQNTADIVGGLFNDIIDWLGFVDVAGIDNPSTGYLRYTGSRFTWDTPSGGGGGGTTLNYPLSDINRAGLSTPGGDGYTIVTKGLGWEWKKVGEGSVTPTSGLTWNDLMSKGKWWGQRLALSGNDYTVKGDLSQVGNINIEKNNKTFTIELDPDGRLKFNGSIYATGGVSSLGVNVRNNGSIDNLTVDGDLTIRDAAHEYSHKLYGDSEGNLHIDGSEGLKIDSDVIIENGHSLYLENNSEIHATRFYVGNNKYIALDSNGDLCYYNGGVKKKIVLTD